MTPRRTVNRIKETVSEGSIWCLEGVAEGLALICVWKCSGNYNLTLHFPLHLISLYLLIHTPAADFLLALETLINANASKKEHTTLDTLILSPIYRSYLISPPSQSYPTSWAFSNLVHLSSEHGGYDSVFNLTYENHRKSWLSWLMSSTTIISEFCLSSLQWKSRPSAFTTD